ncbi:YicC/YloC family endoribonuclease [Vagococcus xieshaowenii]|uniref:YicC family protein n=1 Tax=Vagococcus xieshaowenii TaxID=2562451 RepID=A0AAJ5EEP5_9ENTE|nr:YicC/YloC family endoribonuclease [Vagococcus xieshaowenii]QCA28938.1 YicC family protein [Vagococcus xieshaowenii]TFZ39250.1 YicC family protein [Vagococcus xieshaowenii]
MKSMTGFGKSQSLNNNIQVEIEIKSVNHRFLDTQFRMPRELLAFENDYKTVLKELIQRGRVESYITVTTNIDNQRQLMIHWSLLDELVLQLNQASEMRYKEKAFNPESIMTGLVTNPQFFEVTENKEMTQEDAQLIMKCYREAVERLDSSRLAEGKQIAGVLTVLLNEFEQQMLAVKELVPEIEQDYRHRLEKRLKQEVGEQFEESRLLTELALLIEKGDIQEELDRLVIHIKKAHELITTDGPIGREFDFLLQEMNREVNTTGSKSVNIAVKELIVQMKTMLEKIKEQIQNIE